MKKLIPLIMTIIMVTSFQFASGQETKVPKKIYNPEANAKEDIKNAIQQAKKENKHVFVQVGGNWCGWCLLFHQYINDEPEIKSLIESNYVFTLLNYSQENKNIDLLTQYRNPGRMGYPVFLILDGNGKLIHTQDSGLLEEGKGYDKRKVSTFLKNWSHAALDTKNLK
jgi:thiol:disulfide interchange protein